MCSMRNSLTLKCVGANAFRKEAHHRPLSAVARGLCAAIADIPVRTGLAGMRSGCLRGLVLLARRPPKKGLARWLEKNVKVWYSLPECQCTLRHMGTVGARIESQQVYLATSRSYSAFSFLFPLQSVCQALRFEPMHHKVIFAFEVIGVKKYRPCKGHASSRLRPRAHEALGSKLRLPCAQSFEIQYSHAGTCCQRSGASRECRPCRQEGARDADAGTCFCC